MERFLLNYIESLYINEYLISSGILKKNSCAEDKQFFPY